MLCFCVLQKHAWARAPAQQETSCLILISCSFFWWFYDLLLLPYLKYFHSLYLDWTVDLFSDFEHLCICGIFVIFLFYLLCAFYGSYTD